MLLKMSSNFIKVFLNMNFNQNLNIQKMVAQLCAVKGMRK